MKTSHTISLLLTSLLISFAGAVHAQGAAANRETVKMDRNTFLSMFNWSETSSQWVLKSGMVPPAGLKSREEIIGMRDQFLSMNVWSEVNSEFVPIKGGKPRDLSTLSRDQVKMESLMFNMTHRFDEPSSTWIKTMR
jgi:hypothetical protein